MLRVSHSTIKKWKHCKRAYNYHLVENIEPRVHAIQLYRGTIVHKMIETNANGGDWKIHLKEVEKFLDTLMIEEMEDITEYKNLREDLEKIMKGYFERYADDGLVYTHTELELEYPIFPGRAVLTAKVDGIVRRPDGSHWIMEHKSHKKFPSEEFRFTATQAMFYFWLLQKLGYPKISGIIWDYVRTVTPNEPEPLKKGGLSKAQKTLGGTDYDTYFDAIEKYGLNPDDYAEQLDILEADDERFYRRVWLPLNQKMVNNSMRDFKETILEMIHLVGRSRARNLSEFNCRGCGYKELCWAELTGSDTEFVRKRKYQPRSKGLSIDSNREDEIENGNKDDDSEEQVGETIDSQTLEL